MLERETIRRHVTQVLTAVDLPWPHRRLQGKVRESFFLPPDRRLLVTTDRLSAFDRVLAAVPFKGQVLNELSAFWFRETASIVPNHLLAVPDPNVSLVRACTPLPVEVIVRGYITGVTRTSLWALYAAGERSLYGYDLPEGLQKNDPLPQPLVTPTTKSGPGQHDERLTCDEVVGRGLVDAATWKAVSAAALALFRKGQDVARRAGFVLVDTKYEFGRAADGTVVLIDELHTPDSSRFWRVDDYSRSRRSGDDPEQWDKEYVRLWYAAEGYRGDGPPPALPAEMVVDLAWRYIALYEGLTGRAFLPGLTPPGPRVVEALRAYLA